MLNKVKFLFIFRISVYFSFIFEFWSRVVGGAHYLFILLENTDIMYLILKASCCLLFKDRLDSVYLKKIIYIHN